MILNCRHHSGVELELIEQRAEMVKWQDSLPACAIYRCPVILANGMRCPWMHMVFGSFMRRICTICQKPLVFGENESITQCTHEACRRKRLHRRNNAFAAVQQKRAANGRT